MTDAGLLVPAGSTERTISPENQRLLEFDKSLDISSLVCSLQDAYITAAKYEDNDVIRYRKKFEGKEAEKLADLVIDALAYHINFRHFSGMSPEMAAMLEDVTDANGRSYLDIVVRSKFNVEKKSLEELFARDDVTSESIGALGHRLAQGYEQSELAEALRNEYGRDAEKYRKGILNINSVFSIAPKLREDGLRELALDKLTELYVELVLKAKDKD